MENVNLTYEVAKEAAMRGSVIQRYGDCREIRLSTVGDYDHIPNVNLDGVLVEDCENRKCDCKTGIFRPTEEDLLATDWRIIK